MKLSHPAKGHRQRLRQRFTDGGLSALHDYEILETLLYQSVLYADTQATAKALLEKFGSLRNVLAADKNSLVKTAGVGENTATTLKLFANIVGYLAENQDKFGRQGFLNRHQIARHFFDTLCNREYETVFFLCLDQNFCTVYTGEFTQNDRNAVTPPPFMEIFSRAVGFGAKYIYFAHNHPEGIAYPSKPDTEFTYAAISAATSVQMIVLDHLIVTDIDTYSFFYGGKLGKLMREMAIKSKLGEVGKNLDFYSLLYFPQFSATLSNNNKEKIIALSEQKKDYILTKEQAIAILSKQQK